MSQHWMAWYEFVPYSVGLYVLAIYLVDILKSQPATKFTYTK